MTETDFDALYRSDPDPFEVATSWYERRKQQVVLAALAAEHYGVAWDCAAGTGHLAQALAPRCERVVATDASPTSVDLVRALTREQQNVVSEVNRLPRLPELARGVELVVLAEVQYYLAEADRHAVLAVLPTTVRELALVHWAHHPHDALLSGRDVHEETARLLDDARWHRAVRHDEDDFVVDTWVRRS